MQFLYFHNNSTMTANTKNTKKTRKYDYISNTLTLARYCLIRNATVLHF